MPPSHFKPELIERDAMRNLILSMVRNEEGQDLIEYGLLIGIITLAALTAIRSIGPTVGGYFTALDTLLT